MKTIVFSTNYRNTENWIPLFKRINSKGGCCEAIYLPWIGDVSASQIHQLSLPIRHLEEIHSLDYSGISPQALDILLKKTIDDQIDIIFLCDMQTYPSTAIYKTLSNKKKNPLVIGLQHGLFQSWWVYNQNFGADYFLCFGERHRQELLPPLRDKTIPVGLPKLDLLSAKETTDNGYILYLAQRVPKSADVSNLLRELEQKTQLPILVRNHPQYPKFVDHVPQLPLPTIKGLPATEATLIDQIAGASWVMTPHSTGGLEALQMQKPLVLIPNHGLTAWAGYPGIATDLTAIAVLEALYRAKTRKPEIEMFLDSALGGLRFDHTERAIQTVERLFHTIK